MKYQCIECGLILELSELLEVEHKVDERVWECPFCGHQCSEDGWLLINE